MVGTALLTSVALAGCGEVANPNSSDHGGSKHSSSSPTGTASSKPEKSPKKKPKPSLKLTPNVSDDASDVHVDKQLAVSANQPGGGAKMMSMVQILPDSAIACLLLPHAFIPPSTEIRGRIDLPTAYDMHACPHADT